MSGKIQPFDHEPTVDLASTDPRLPLFSPFERSIRAATKWRREQGILAVTAAVALVDIGLNLLGSAIKAHKQSRRKKQQRQSRE
ncbi:hypothetical protein BHE74_00047734 [Ensete ventricosum]|nr:hypothetical protein BHE74_00047734 [Ensete ventricosum]